MRILFDLAATQPNTSKFHGGSEYAKFVFYSAIKEGYHFSVCYDPSRPLHDDVLDAISKYELECFEYSNVDELNKIVKDNMIDRFYSSLPYGLCDFDTSRTSMYITVHGLRALELKTPLNCFRYQKGFLKSIYSIVFNVSIYILNLLGIKLFSFQKQDKALKKLITKKNCSVITVSNYSLSSIKRYFPNVNTDNVFLCYPPYNFSYDEMSSEINIPDNYFLLVSSDRWIKNNILAMKALDAIISANKDYNVCVLGANNAIRSQRLKNKSNFYFYDYVSENDLNFIFKNAFCFIYPTLNEGFGYPPVTAFKFDTPVIASGGTSVPEVCCDAALYFNPSSQSDLEIKITRIILDDSLRTHLVKRGNVRFAELKQKNETMIDSLIQHIFEK